jgi:hypothetical protein
MKVKQIIITVSAPEGTQRVVFNPKGEVLAGDKARVIKLGSTNSHRRAITIRGTKGESVHANINVRDLKGGRVSRTGNVEAVSDALRDTCPGLIGPFLALSQPGDAQGSHPQHQHPKATDENTMGDTAPSDSGADDPAATLSA